MKMVSTRGVKFKFQEGEKVLCYEPDATKAKVLYDSKVLEVRIGKDDKGKKIGEYLIHFNGWNSSWDRYVSEELILKDSEENRSLQRKLAEEAALQLKNKKKRQRFVEIFKKSEDKKIKTAKLKNETNSTNKSDLLHSENNVAEEIYQIEETLNIPPSLKRWLERDHCFINKKKMLIKLPCEPNVVTILEDYVKYYLMKTLTSQKNEEESKLNLANQVNLCKEVADGLRIYFDFTLSHILLYASEKKQYECLVRDSRCSHYLNDLRHSKIPMKPYSEPLPQLSDDVQSSNESAKFKSKRLQSSVERRPCRSLSMLRKNKFENVSANDPDYSTIPVHRILRSSNGTIDSCKSKSNANQCLMDSSTTLSNPCTKSESNLIKASDKSSDVYPLILRKTDKKNVNGQIPTDDFIKQRIEPISTDLNTRDAVDVIKIDRRSSTKQHLSLENTHLIHETLTWTLIPFSHQRASFFPSLVYGAQHLLRLFVKLPDLLVRSNMQPRKARLLGKHLQMFLGYLEEKQNDLLHESVYFDPQDEMGNCDPPCVR